MTRLWQITDRETGALVAVASGYTAHAAWLAANLPRAFCLYAFAEVTPEPAAMSIHNRVKRAAKGR